METFEKPLPVPSTYSNLAIKLANDIGLKTKQCMKQRGNEEAGNFRRLVTRFERLWVHLGFIQLN